MLIRGTEVDPVTLLDKPRVKIVEASELIPQLSDPPDKTAWEGPHSRCPHGVGRSSGRRAELPWFVFGSLAYREFWQIRQRKQQTLHVVMKDIKELGTILSIWAHPDDEVYLCGGIMAMAAAAVRAWCASRPPGRARRHRSDSWPPEQLPAIREAELASACASWA